MFIVGIAPNADMGELLYQGKVKQVWSTENPEILDLLRLGREAREGVIGQHDVIIDDWLDLVNRAASHRRSPKLEAARAQTGSRRTFAAQND